jgi:hypothetical protein
MPAQEPPPIFVGKVVHYLAAQYCAEAVDVQECIHTLQGKGKVDNAAVTEHHQPINKYSLMDPDLLLTLNRFLVDAKFEALGRGPTSHQLLWLADMDSAIAALHLAKMGSLTPQASLYFLEESPSPCLYPGQP